MMKSKDKLWKRLLEQVRQYDDLIELPDEIKFNTRTKNRVSISNLNKSVEDFNKFPNDKDSLLKLKEHLIKSIFGNLINYIYIKD